MPSQTFLKQCENCGHVFHASSESKRFCCLGCEGDWNRREHVSGPRRKDYHLSELRAKKKCSPLYFTWSEY